MADDVWRLDYQMDEHADPESISRPEVAGARLREQLGPDVEFEFVWIGPYQYRDHLLDTFRVGRTIFIGDAAHVVCPFGARGGNNGIQDAANLGWKLALVLQGQAGEALLDSYHARAPRRGGREPARDEPDGALPRAAQRRRASPAPRGRRPRAHARVRAQARQHRPDGAGQRLSAVAVGAARRALAAERRLRRHDGDAPARRRHALPRPVARRQPRRGSRRSTRARARWSRSTARASTAHGALARHLGAARRQLVLVRPDAYVAARCSTIGDAGGAIEAALRRAPLAPSETPHEHRAEHRRSRRLLRGLGRRPRGPLATPRAPTSTPAWSCCWPTRSAT